MATKYYISKNSVDRANEHIFHVQKLIDRAGGITEYLKGTAAKGLKPNTRKGEQKHNG